MDRRDTGQSEGQLSAALYQAYQERGSTFEATQGVTQGAPCPSRHGIAYDFLVFDVAGNDSKQGQQTRHVLMIQVIYAALKASGGRLGRVRLYLSGFR